MGYTTSFCGSFEFSRELTEQEYDFLSKFYASRRMKWDVAKLQTYFTGKHGNPFTPEDPYGPEGAYFNFDNDQECYHHPALLDYNSPPTGQPGIWCHWQPSMNSLSWDGGVKFYHYTEWLQYLIDHFFTPWGIQLNGAIQWEGEDSKDIGVISVRNNYINVHYEEDVGN